MKVDDGDDGEDSDDNFFNNHRRSGAKKATNETTRSTPSPSSLKRRASGKTSSTRSSPRKSSNVKLSDANKDKDDSDSDPSSDSDDDDVEALRKRNIEDNLRFLAELGIQNTKDEIRRSVDDAGSTTAKRRDVKGLKRDSVAKSPPAPRRVSLRQRKIDSDGLALAPNYIEPSEGYIRRGLVAKVSTFFAQPRADLNAQANDDNKGRRKIPATPLEMAVALDNGPTPELDDDDLTTMTLTSADDETRFKIEMAAKRERREAKKKECAKNFIAELTRFVRTGKEPEDEDAVGTKDEQKFVKEMKKLRCSEALERKVGYMLHV